MVRERDGGSGCDVAGWDVVGCDAGCEDWESAVCAHSEVPSKTQLAPSKSEEIDLKLDRGKHFTWAPDC
jgi:hypothetical protein